MSDSSDWYEQFLWQQSDKSDGSQKESADSTEKEAGEEVEEEKRTRCYDVIVKYEPTEGTLTGKKLEKALEKLKPEHKKKSGMFLDKLLKGKKPERKPVPAREIWKSGVSFLSKEELETHQCLVMIIRFGATTRLPTTIHAQGHVEKCGEGKGRYPFKIEATFTDLNREAFEVLKNPKKYLPRK